MTVDTARKERAPHRVTMPKDKKCRHDCRHSRPGGQRHASKVRLFGAFAMAAMLLPAADPLSDSARKKLDMIEDGKASRGSIVSFSTAEINAWARVKVPEIVPEGIRDIRVEMGAGTATAYAIVDFLKMRQAQGVETGWFVSKLIEGERPLRVTVRLESAGGRCTVYLTRVDLSNVSASATVLDFLVKAFFVPLYPDAKINEPFDLDFNMERIEVRPGVARVVIKK
jgi:hypothetical protein